MALVSAQSNSSLDGQGNKSKVSSGIMLLNFLMQAAISKLSLLIAVIMYALALHCHRIQNFGPFLHCCCPRLQPYCRTRRSCIFHPSFSVAPSLTGMFTPVPETEITSTGQCDVQHLQQTETKHILCKDELCFAVTKTSHAFFSFSYLSDPNPDVSLQSRLKRYSRAQNKIICTKQVMRLGAALKEGRGVR